MEYASFANTTMPFVFLPDMIIVLQNVKKEVTIYLRGSVKKGFKINIQKCYLLTSWKAPETLQVSGSYASSGNSGSSASLKFNSESKVPLVGTNVDNRLNFDYHVSQFCKKVSKKTCRPEFKIHRHIKALCSEIWMFFRRLH